MGLSGFLGFGRDFWGCWGLLRPLGSLPLFLAVLRDFEGEMRTFVLIPLIFEDIGKNLVPLEGVPHAGDLRALGINENLKR